MSNGMQLIVVALLGLGALIYLCRVFRHCFGSSKSCGGKGGACGCSSSPGGEKKRVNPR